MYREPLTLVKANDICDMSFMSMLIANYKKKSGNYRIRLRYTCGYSSLLIMSILNRDIDLWLYPMPMAIDRIYR